MELHKLHAREEQGEEREGEAGRPGVILWTVCNICLREFFGNIRLHILRRHRDVKKERKGKEASGGRGRDEAGRD